MTLRIMRATIARSGLLLGVVLLATGCASYEREFADRPSDQVWSSLLAVAQAPEYDDPDPAMRWTVIDNEVWVDEPGRRIEIYRRLARRLYQPPGKALDQEREWRFRVSLEDDDPPTAKFMGRGPYVHAHVAEESRRYFDDVSELLGTESVE